MSIKQYVGGYHWNMMLAAAWIVALVYLSLSILILTTTPAYAQSRVYTNADLDRKSTSVSFTVPQSIIDAARDAALLVDSQSYHGPTFNLGSHDPKWPFTNAVLLPPEPKRKAPVYYGPFVPLTPYGPLINSAFLPPMRGPRISTTPATQPPRGRATVRR